MIKCQIKTKVTELLQHVATMSMCCFNAADKKLTQLNVLFYFLFLKRSRFYCGSDEKFSGKNLKTKNSRLIYFTLEAQLSR